MKYVFYYCILVFSTNSLWLFPQEPESKFDQIDIHRGLSENEVNSIIQDDLGFIWVGTSNGLNKYDGYSFKVFKFQRKDNYILSGFINKLFKDNSGMIWAGTDDGLQCFNPQNESFIHYQHSNTSSSSLLDNAVNDIYTNSDSILWVGTQGGLSQFNLKSKTFKNFKPYPDIINKPKFNSIKVITADRNNLYLGTNTELLSFNIKTETFKVYKYKNYIAIRSLCFENANKILIGTYGSGFYSLNIRNDSITPIGQIMGLKFPDIITSVVKLKNGIYLGTNDGLIYANSLNDKPQVTHYRNDPLNPANSCPNAINCLSYDKSGNLWIGSQQDGCFKLNLETKPFKNYTSPIDNKTNKTPPTVRTMVELDSTHLIIGTLGSGLYLFNRKTALFNSIKFTTNDAVNKITSTCVNKQQYILIGTEGAGLFVGKLDKSGLSNNHIQTKDVIRYTSKVRSNLSFPSDYIMCLLEDHNRNIWIGTWGGLVLCKMTISGELEILQHFEYVKNNNNSLTNSNILCIYEDVNGTVWVGTRKGLNKITVNKNRHFEIRNYFVNQEKNNGLISNMILSIYEDKHKCLWVGTNGGGIAHFDREKEQFIHYTIDEKIGSNNIAGIMEDQRGNFWLGTSKGLLLFDPDKKIFSNFYESNGKACDYLINSCVRTHDNEFYFGNTMGITSFKPLLIKHRTFRSPTVISNFSIHNKPVPIAKPFDKRIILKNSISYTKDLIIKHNENEFTFEFSSLDFSSPDKIQYAYMLEGFDKDWVFTNSFKRFANYSNLPAGDYTFKVKGTNSDGIWNDSPAVLRIQVLPPFWKTWWAQILYTIIIVSLISFYIRYRVKLNELKNNLKFEHLEREKLNEIHQMKLRFFANISHEFRTPLTLVIAPLEKMLGSSGLDSEIKYQLGVMNKNVNRLLRLINQILDLARAESDQIKLNLRNGDIVIYVKSLLSSFDLRSQQQSIQLLFSSDRESHLVSFDHDIIEKIVYNLLSNAFKHTQIHGTICVSINTLESPLIEIRVKDNGIGIPKELHEKIFERFFQVDNFSVKERKGTGLGLSLVKALVDIYKGNIVVSSIPGQGAEFIITIPVNDPINELSSNNASFIYTEQEKTILPSLDPHKSHIVSKVMLIIEDNEEMRKYICKNFESEYKILEAINGLIGLELARKNMPDIIISDVMMPEMDGMEFCKKIKTDERTSHIPVLMLTALDTNEYRIEGVENGADAYLTKPFNVRHLEVTTRALIASREKLRAIFSQKMVIDPAEITVTSTDEKFMRKLITLIEKKMNEPNFNIESICEEIGMSRTSLHHKIKALTGQTSSEFLRAFRIKRAAQLLLKGLTVSETMYEVGINSRSYYIKSFKEIFGVLPSEYAKTELEKFKPNN